MQTTTLHITGMTCGHCAGTVERALLGVEGVRSVRVELPDRATIEHDGADIAALIRAVEAEEYTAEIAP